MKKRKNIVIFQMILHNNLKINRYMLIVCIENIRKYINCASALFSSLICHRQNIKKKRIALLCL